MRVMINMGISEIGDLQPISTEEGNSTRNEITIPFITGTSFRLVVAIRKPDTHQSRKADRFASQVSF